MTNDFLVEVHPVQYLEYIILGIHKLFCIAYLKFRFIGASCVYLANIPVEPSEGGERRQVSGSLQTTAKSAESCWNQCKGLWVVAGMGSTGSPVGCKTLPFQKALSGRCLQQSLLGDPRRKSPQLPPPLQTSPPLQRLLTAERRVQAASHLRSWP